MRSVASAATGTSCGASSPSCGRAASLRTVEPGLHVLRPLPIPPAGRVGRRAQLAALRVQIRLALRRLGLRGPAAQLVQPAGRRAAARAGSASRRRSSTTRTATTSSSHVDAAPAARQRGRARARLRRRDRDRRAARRRPARARRRPGGGPPRRRGRALRGAAAGARGPGRARAAARRLRRPDRRLHGPAVHPRDRRQPRARARWSWSAAEHRRATRSTPSAHRAARPPAVRRRCRPTCTAFDCCLSRSRPAR